MTPPEFGQERYEEVTIKDFFVLRMTEEEAALLHAIMLTLKKGAKAHSAPDGLAILLNLRTQAFAAEVVTEAEKLVKPWIPPAAAKENPFASPPNPKVAPGLGQLYDPPLLIPRPTEGGTNDDATP